MQSPASGPGTKRPRQVRHQKICIQHLTQTIHLVQAFVCSQYQSASNVQAHGTANKIGTGIRMRVMKHAADLGCI